MTQVGVLSVWHPTWSKTWPPPRPPTYTCANLYPWQGVGVFLGTGAGVPCEPEGYLCQSLSRSPVVVTTLCYFHFNPFLLRSMWPFHHMTWHHMTSIPLLITCHGHMTLAFHILTWLTVSHMSHPLSFLSHRSHSLCSFLLAIQYLWLIVSPYDSLVCFTYSWTTADDTIVHRWLNTPILRTYY